MVASAVPDGAKTLRRLRDGQAQQPGNPRRCRRLDLRFRVQYGVLRADDAAVRAGEERSGTAQRASYARMGLTAYTLAVALLNREAAADRQRGWN